jgi:hypothetical protein
LAAFVGWSKSGRRWRAGIVLLEVAEEVVSLPLTGYWCRWVAFMSRCTIISVLLIEGIAISSASVEAFEDTRSESESLTNKAESKSSPAHLVLSFGQIWHPWYAVALPSKRTL